MSAGRRATASRSLRLCLWCLAAAVAEVGLYLSYRGHDARFHWFTHFFVGASAALLAMTVATRRAGRPLAYPLVWPVLGHLFAMTPDVLFAAGVAHQRWMDLFLGHISAHAVPGRNLTWYVVFIAAVAVYLLAVAPSPSTARPPGACPDAAAASSSSSPARAWSASQAAAKAPNDSGTTTG